MAQTEGALHSHESGFNDPTDWSLANWGTCDADDFEMRREEKDWLEFAFTTAWSPPEPVFKRMAELFPTLLMSVVAIEEYDECVLRAVVAHGEYAGRRPLSPSLMEAAG